MSPALTLADDPSFKRPDYADGIAEDPRCEQQAGWPQFRGELFRLEMEEAAALSLSFVFDVVLANATMMDKLDDASSVCFMGVVAALFFIARDKLDTARSVDGAAYFFKSLDQYVSSLHPRKLDAAAGNGTWWPVTDRAIGQLRRRILRESANSTKGTSIKATSGRDPGNAFQVLPDTLVEGSVPLSSSARVFVYDIDDYEELQILAQGPSFCRDNQWGFEVMLHDWFLACPCRTDNPEEADFFFVPQYTACHLNVDTFSELESQRLFEQLVPSLRFFRRSGGHDHLFVWGSGMAADGPFRSWRSFIKNSIFLMTETELWNPFAEITEPSYNPWKDIVLPGRLTLQEIQSSVQLSGTPLSSRRFLAEFVGWWRPLHASQGPGDSPRKAILRWAGTGGEDKDRLELESDELFIKQDVPYSEAYQGSVSSRFCLVPRGKSAWSSRFFRVLFAGCVPVLLNDYYEPPFEAFLDVTKWLIKWPMRRVDDGLLDYLRAVPMGTVESMLDHSRRDRCWYIYPPSALDYEQTELQKGKLDRICPNWRTQNAFFGVMQQLVRKKRSSKTSFTSFYMPLGSKHEVQYMDAEFRPLLG